MFMKKMLLIAVCFSAVVVSAKTNASNRTVQFNEATHNARLEQKIERATVNQLQLQLREDLALLNRAADQKKLDDVITIGTRVMKQAKALEKYVSPNDKVAIINGSPTLAYVLWEAEPAEEFVAIAKIMQKKTTLTKLLDRHSDLFQNQGFFAWVSGRIETMHVRYAPMADEFMEWSGCATEVSQAQEKGIPVRSVNEVCTK